jgi:hypothetical protein
MQINKFALQVEETPLYIVYKKINDIDSSITITDIALNSEIKRVIKCQIDDSITHLLFIVSLIRDEYNTQILFTEKSQL